MIWWFVCMLALLANLLVSQLLRQRLRSNHSTLWQDLGQLQTGGSNLSTQWRRLIVFVWSLEFRKATDATLRRLCWMALAGEIVALLAFGALLFFPG